MEQGEVMENGKEYTTRLHALELENRKLREEFDSQRAKLKELYLQKEAELAKTAEEKEHLTEQVNKLKNQLDDLKSQLVVDRMRESDFEVEKQKAEAEIASLQRLIHETVEESSSSRSSYEQDLDRLQMYIQQLQKEIEYLKYENAQFQQQAQTSSQVRVTQIISACLNLLAWF